MGEIGILCLEERKNEEVLVLNGIIHVDVAARKE
jgi:hypothetical protein